MSEPEFLKSAVHTRETRSGVLRAVRGLAPSVAWTTTGAVFNQGSTLVSNIWIANLLGKSLFGEFAIVLATVQATVAMDGVGIGYTTTRYLAEWRHRDPVRAGKLLVLFNRLSWVAAIASTGLLAAWASWIANGALAAPSVRQPLLIAALATLFNVRNGFLTGALQGLESFRFIGIGGVISGIGYLLLTAGGARVDGVRGAAIGLLASSMLQCAVLTFAVHQERQRQQLARDSADLKQELPLILRFALPGALSPICTVPVLWAVQAFLVRSPNRFAELAVYAVGLNLLTIAMFPPSMLGGVAMVHINRALVVDGEVGYRSALRLNIGVTLALVVVSVLAVALLGPTILSLYGKDFRTGYVAIALLLLAAIPESLTNALFQSLQTRERMWQALAGINFPRDLTMIVVAWKLIPVYGAAGAAAAYLAGRIVALVSTSVMVRHEVRMPRTVGTPARAK